MGKTTTIIAFLNHLLGSPDHEEVGVLICLSRLSEIKRVVREAGLDVADFAVYTTDTEINSLSPTEPDQARVLFTTQQMLQSRLEGKRFETCEAFHYQRLPREVRVWDETIDPGRVTSIDSDTIGSLPSLVRPVSSELADALGKLQIKLAKAEVGDMIAFPDLNTELLIVLAKRLKAKPRERISLEALVRMSGQRALVSTAWGRCRSAVLASELWPSDLAPMLVLDASARVRGTYRHWSAQRFPVFRLPSAVKDYGPLTIRVVNKGASKASWREDGEGLARDIADMVRSKSHERWLIVHHKAMDTCDPEALLRQELGELASRVSFLPWGSHQATNDHADIDNIILAGTLFLPPSHLGGLAHASLGVPMDEELPDGVLEEITMGEHGHGILQAIGRGSCRGTIDGRCVPAEVFIVAASSSGIRKALGEWFPGAKVATWQPPSRPLKGKVAEAVAYIRERLEASPEAPISFADVMVAIDCTDRPNFNRTIRKHHAFRQTLHDLGVVEISMTGGKRPNGFRQLERPKG